MNKGFNLVEIKKQNRSKILRMLKTSGPLSRKDIAAKLGLTQAAITIIINEMIKENIIEEKGYDSEGANKAGRRKVLLDLNDNFGYVIGVSIIYKKMTIALSNIGGEIVDSYDVEYEKLTLIDCEYIIDFIIEKSLKLIWNNAIEKDSLLGIGIGIIGLVEHLDHNYIRTKISKELHLNVVIDTIVNTLAMAELDFHGNDELRHMLFLKYGPGLGLTIVQNGQFIYGNKNMAGEVGHVVVNPTLNTTCRCGRKGCLEAIVSEPDLIDSLKELNYAFLNDIVNEDGVTLNFPMVNERVKLNDILLINFLEERFDYLGMILANTIVLLSPSDFVLFGRLFNEELLLEMVHKSILKYLGTNSETNIRVSTLDPNFKTVGPIALALRQLYYNVGAVK